MLAALRAPLSWGRSWSAGALRPTCAFWPVTVAFAIASAGCSESDDKAAEPNGVDAGVDAGSDAAADTGGDAPSELPLDGTLPAHARELPFDYTRPDTGTKVTAQELSDATDLYLDLLRRSRYFELIEERAHGWPESDPEGRYWYATWWSGVDVVKAGDTITYLHADGGADNNGLRTAQLLEGACYAHLLYGDPKIEHLMRRFVRGFTSWILAMEREPDDPAGAILTRAFYPESIADTERQVAIDYSLNRPGVDNGATEYVHNPNNPHWGDIWVKNKRSKDDIGHMLRAIGQLDACDGKFTETGAQEELVELRRLYQAWSRRVEDDGWKIVTYDKNLELWIPTGSLANFITLGGAECSGMLAIRLLGRFAPSADTQCGNGIGGLDTAISNANDQNGEILRTFHEAAANHALLAGNDELARELLTGLAERLETSLDGFEAGTPPKFMNEHDLAHLMIHSVNVGVPLTSREVRFLHARIAQAHTSFGSPQNDSALRVRDSDVPDGSYWFELWTEGIEWKTLGALLGSCAAQYRNPASEPVLDCAKIAAFDPSGP
jgi:hypothetical protein